MFSISKFAAVGRIACLAVALSLVWSVSAHAQQNSGPVVFGFVNLQQIGENAQAAQKASEVIANYRASVEERIRQQQEALRQEEQALNRRRSILAPDAFREEERKFREKLDVAQRRFQEIGRQLQQAAFEAQQTLSQKINEVIIEVANERDMNIVLNQGQAHYVEPLERFDITQTVIQRLDQQLPEIPVNLPKE